MNLVTSFTILLLVGHVSSQQCYRTTDGLNLRNGPSKNNPTITTIPAGSTVTRIGSNQPWADGFTWYNIQWGSSTGWAVNNYLTSTACGSSPPPPSGGCTFTMSDNPSFQAQSTAPLTKNDIVSAARGLGVEPAAVKAVTDVEAGANGFLDGKPKILFESFWFWKLTGGKWGNDCSFSCDHWDRSAYRYGNAEYDRLRKAYQYDRSAALQSASWGAFQVMGFNYQAVGYSTVEAFIADELCGSAGHMRAFLGFVRNKGLVTNLKNKDWAGFAYRYNGAGYKANNYDVKMANAYNAALAAGYNNLVFSDDADQTLLFLTHKHNTYNPTILAATIAAVVAVITVVAVVIVVRRRRAVAPSWDPLIATETELTVV